jgi:hypothetical protein
VNANPDSSTGAAAASAGLVLDEDVPCIACEYNLRGMTADARCPECGGEVRPSLVAHRAGGLTVDQARRLRAVASLALTAIVIMVVTGITEPNVPGLNLMAMLAATLAWVLVAIAALRLPHLPDRPVLRRATVIATVAACAMPALFISAVPLGLGPMWRWWPLQLLPLALSMTATVLLLTSLAHAARRARLPGTALLMRLATVLVPIAGAVITFVVPLNGPSYSPDFLIRQPGPLFGFASTIGMVAANFRPRYFGLWQFYAWLIQPAATIAAAAALHRLGKQMTRIVNDHGGQPVE